MSQGGSILGNAVRRREDPRLIRGAGSYVGDMAPDGTLHAVFVRSHVAHGRVTAVDTAEAKDSPGVVDVAIASDVNVAPLSIWDTPPQCARPVLSTTVRHVGDPIAVVIAETERLAQDAAALVFADIEAAPTVVDPVEALDENAPLLFPELGSNVALEGHAGTTADPLAGAEVIVEARLVNQRLAALPLEGAGGLAVPEADDRLTMYLSIQDVFNTRNSLADMLGMDPDEVRVIAPDVGGGFGAKGDLAVEHAVIADAARRHGRPVRWVETRTENLINMPHGRAQIQHVRLGAKADGRLVGYQLDVIADLGAYPTVATWLPRYTLEMAAGCYDIPQISASFRSVVTNTTPTGPYRGAGRPEAIQAIERAMDLLAGELGMTPVDLRRRNLIAPFTTSVPTEAGAVYDSGDYPAALQLAIDAAGYESWVAKRDRRRLEKERRQLGVGVACYVEVTVGKTPSQEFGAVELGHDGSVVASAGGANHGQGHETAFAQIVADRFEIPMERIVIKQGDTGEVPKGGGTYASRTVQLAGSSLYESSEELIRLAGEVAANVLEADPHDMAVVPGVGIGVAGSPGSAVPWGDLATTYEDRHGTPLRVEREYPQGASTYPFGTHVAVVEVDVETGEVELLDHTAVDDCGTVINPMLVKGQQHGGIAQGVGQALLEHARFDDYGNPITANLMTYLAPAASDLPSFRVLSPVTPTPLNPLGAKGVGEAGTLGSTPAVHSAVIDALRPFGTNHLDLPLRPESLWQAINDRSESRTRP